MKPRTTCDATIMMYDEGGTLASLRTKGSYFSGGFYRVEKANRTGEPVHHVERHLL
jgi:hypothetical protein